MAFRPTDIELIREVLQDFNARAFETLMKRYTSQVYGSALRLLKDENNAQEVTQMAFIQAYRQLDSWRGENFGAWVTIIANHIASDGESNWLEGLQLVAVYVIIGTAFFFV